LRILKLSRTIFGTANKENILKKPLTPHWNKLKGMSSREFLSLPKEFIYMLIDELDKEERWLEYHVALLNQRFEEEYGLEIEAAYAEKQQNYGIVTINTAEGILTVNRSRRTNWDQDMLEAIQNSFHEMDEDPDQYIKTEEVECEMTMLEFRDSLYFGDLMEKEYCEIKYSVSDKKYEAWPEKFRKIFDKARKPTTEKTEFTLTRNDH